MKKERILLVGCGNMGVAILQACLEGGYDVAVVDQNSDVRQTLQNQGLQAYKDTAELEKSKFTEGTGNTGDLLLIIYAIKPQNSASVLPFYRYLAGNVIHISIMAGVKISTITKLLGDDDQAVVRSMPNLPIAIKRGTIVSVGNHHISDDIRNRVDSVFSFCGTSLWLEDEDLMHAVTALSGSGPGYVFHYMEEMVKAGESLGLDTGLSRDLVLSFVSGASEMARQKNQGSISLGNLRESVTSKGGTTAAALEVLNDSEKGIGSILRKAVAVAKQRSMYLGGEQ